MDYLWTPWRYRYVTNADKVQECLFCSTLHASDDRQALVVYRARYCFVMLNAYPYSSGHVLIAPYAHVAQLNALDPDPARELMELMQRLDGILRKAYSPDGINFGMNLGRAAGAGIAGHIHMHALPRWFGDTSFITTTAETRVLPEALETTWEKLHAAFASSG